METQTALQRQIKAYEAKSLNPFKPSRNFFSVVQIGQKRFWKIVRGEESPKLTEMKALSEYFEVGVNELFN
jgi:hypothetical protein